MLAVELRLADDSIKGTLVLPFGLALDDGVTLQIDDAEPSRALRFQTCLPVGCLVALDFNGQAITALRKAAALKVTAVAQSGGEMSLSISLKGFSTALDRATELVQ